jgi:hypothetical protein
MKCWIAFIIYKIKAETEMANFVAMQAEERIDISCQLQFVTKIKPQSLTHVSCTYVGIHDA